MYLAQANENYTSTIRYYINCLTTGIIDIQNVTEENICLVHILGLGVSW